MSFLKEQCEIQRRQRQRHLRQGQRRRHRQSSVKRPEQNQAVESEQQKTYFMFAGAETFSGVELTTHKINTAKNYAKILRTE